MFIRVVAPDNVIIERIEMRIITIVISVLAICVVAATALEVHRERPAPAVNAETQDPVYLGQRISMLEQRLNSIESNIRTLEQQINSQRLTPSQPTSNPESALLRSELEILRSLVRELQCGVVHLDERTLSTAAKDARRRTGTQSTDPCRLNPETPVQFTTLR